MRNLLNKINCFKNGSKKMATFASVPKHPPSTSLWKKGDGVFPKKQITISFWNVNGYRSILKKGNLEQYIQLVGSDIICLGETKVDLKAFQDQKLQQKHVFPGYHQYWNFCKVSAGYSGTMILSKIPPIQIIQDFPNSMRHSLEGRLIALKFDQFYLLNVYKPNAGRTLQRLQYRVQEYDHTFEEYVKLLQKDKPVVIAGDLNVAHHEIDLANPSKNKKNAGFTMEERGSFDRMLKKSDLVDSFRSIHPKTVKYTWWSNFKDARASNIGWRIDYILTDSKIKVQNAEIYDQIKGSDHCPISATISIPG